LNKWVWKEAMKGGNLNRVDGNRKVNSVWKEAMKGRNKLIKSMNRKEGIVWKEAMKGGNKKLNKASLSDCLGFEGSYEGWKPTSRSNC